MKRQSKFGALFLAIVAVAAMAVSSCSTTPASSPSPNTTQSPTASSKPTGTIRFGQTEVAMRAMDPPISEGMTYQSFGSAIFDSLIMLGNDGKPQPAIAERWEISPDGKTHTFYIRKGVKFHDGSDLTAADVKFSLERFIAADATHSQAATMRAALASVDLKDDYTVALNLKAPSGDLLPSFLAYTSAAAVVPKKYIEEKGVDYFRKNPIGSGPWKVVKWQQGGTELELEALESHWRAVPKFKTAKVILVPEEATRLAMLKTGELDVAMIMPDSVPDVKSAGLKILAYDIGNQGAVTLHYDTDNPQALPIGDVRVRKALALAINRNDIANKLFAGYAKPSALWRVGKTGDYFDPNVVKVDPYDPEGAKKLLAEAGYPNGFSMKQVYSAMDSQSIAQAIDSTWRSIGVKSEIQMQESTVIVGLHSPKIQPNLLGVAWTYFSPSTVGWANVAAVYHSRGFHKNTKITRLDELIDKIPAVTDPVERKKMQQEASALIKNDYATIATIDSQQILAYGKNVGEWTPNVGLSAFGSDLEKIPHAK